MKPGHYITFAIIAILCIIGFGPFYTLYQLREGFKTQDAEKISDNVDFPKVRESIKDQMSAQVMQQVKDKKVSGFAALGGLLATAMVDRMITPTGLATMLKQGHPTSGGTVSSNKEPLSNVRYEFDSFSKFSVYAPNNQGKEVRLVLSRDWLDWKVTNIILPLN